MSNLTLHEVRDAIAQFVNSLRDKVDADGHALLDKIAPRRDAARVAPTIGPSVIVQPGVTSGTEINLPDSPVLVPSTTPEPPK